MPIEYVIHHGGLMRCCLATLDEAMEAAEVEPQEGEVLKCKHHPYDEGMIYLRGAWRWNRP
jgi:hypothetical protein